MDVIIGFACCLAIACLVEWCANRWSPGSLGLRIFTEDDE